MNNEAKAISQEKHVIACSTCRLNFHSTVSESEWENQKCQECMYDMERSDEYWWCQYTVPAGQRTERTNRLRIKIELNPDAFARFKDKQAFQRTQRMNATIARKKKAAQRTATVKARYSQHADLKTIRALKEASA